MHCTRVQVDGITAIVCSSKPLQTNHGCSLRMPSTKLCPGAGEFQCDWKLSKGKRPKRCDRYLCKSHAKEVAPEKHLCPEHQFAYQRYLDRQAAKQGKAA